MWVWSKTDKNWCSIKYFLMHVAPSPRIDFFYEARRMPRMPISTSSVHGAVGCPPLPAIFDSNSFVHFISFQLLPKYTKLPGSLERQRKEDKSAFLAFSWTIGSPPQNSYPCTARKGAFFWPYYTTKRKNTAQKRAGQPFHYVARLWEPAFIPFFVLSFAKKQHACIQ